jgi:hypothetical protein
VQSHGNPNPNLPARAKSPDGGRLRLVVVAISIAYQGTQQVRFIRRRLPDLRKVE